MTPFFSYKYYTYKETIMFENAKPEVKAVEEGIQVSNIGIWNIDSALCKLPDEVYEELRTFVASSEENRQEIYRQAVFCSNHGFKFFGLKLGRILGMEVGRLNSSKKDNGILIPKDDVDTYMLRLTRTKDIKGPLNPVYQEFRKTFL